MKLSYDEIRRIHRLEKNSSQLVEVEQDFYNDLYEFLREEKKSYLDSLKNFSSNASDFVNLKKMIEEIFSLREKKIVARALLSARTGESSETHLALQEKVFFKKTVTILQDHNGLLESVFADRQNQKSEPSSLETQFVKIVLDVPSFIGSDMKEYGPFQKDEVIELPLKIAKLLNQRNLAVVSSKA